MILSNWDVLAVDECGRSSNGVSEQSTCGVSVFPYHNWLNISCQSSWQQGSLQPNPIIGTLRDGELTILDVTIVAVRGPADGVYFATWFVDNEEIRATIGLSCYGFVSEQEYQGVTAEHVTFLRSTLRDWVSSRRVPDLLGGIKWNSSKIGRFNQGDAKISLATGQMIPFTLVGQAKMPMAIKWIQENDESNLRPSQTPDSLPDSFGGGPGQGHQGGSQKPQPGSGS